MGWDFVCDSKLFCASVEITYCQMYDMYGMNRAMKMKFCLFAETNALLCLFIRFNRATFLV